MTLTGPTPPGSLPRHLREVARIIELAFTEFENRTYECLSEAQGRIVAEAEAAHEYSMLQLNQLRGSVMKSLGDYVFVPTQPAKVHQKRARPVEDEDASSLIAGKAKQAKYTIADAWEDISAEVKRNSQRGKKFQAASRKNEREGSHALRKTAANEGKRTNASHNSEGRDYEGNLEEQSDEEENGVLGEGGGESVSGEEGEFEDEEEDESGEAEEDESGGAEEDESGEAEEDGTEGAEEDESEDEEAELEGEEEAESEGPTHDEESG